jgi:hypothetical protein
MLRRDSLKVHTHKKFFSEICYTTHAQVRLRGIAFYSIISLCFSIFGNLMYAELVLGVYPEPERVHSMLLTKYQQNFDLVF